MGVVLPALVGPTSARARTDPAAWIAIGSSPNTLGARDAGSESCRLHGAVLGRSRTGPGARAALMAKTLRPEFQPRQITNRCARRASLRGPGPGRPSAGRARARRRAIGLARHERSGGAPAR